MAEIDSEDSRDEIKKKKKSSTEMKLFLILSSKELWSQTLCR